MTPDTRTASSEHQRRNLTHLGNVVMEAVVELDRRAMPFKELRRLQVGEVILASKLAGEAVTLRLNGTPFGEGEITVANNQLGLRLTRLLAPPTQEALP